MLGMSEHEQLVGGNSSAEPPSVYDRGLPPKEEVKDAHFMHHISCQVYNSLTKRATVSTLLVQYWLTSPEEGDTYEPASRWYTYS